MTLDVFFNFFFRCGSCLHSHTLFLFILKFFDVLGLLAASAGHLIQRPNALLSLPSAAASHPAKARAAAAALCAVVLPRRCWCDDFIRELWCY
jgi:hypothetical protein